MSTKRSSKAFDLALLEELKSLTDIPIEEFDYCVAKIMKKKSRKRLCWSNMPVRERDEGKLRECNYRCIPESANAYYLFCLDLDRGKETITVRDGFLAPLVDGKEENT